MRQWQPVGRIIRKSYSDPLFPVWQDVKSRGTTDKHQVTFEHFLSALLHVFSEKLHKS